MVTLIVSSWLPLAYLSSPRMQLHTNARVGSRVNFPHQGVKLLADNLHSLAAYRY